MKANDNQFVWAEKYRPNTIAECILPKAIKDRFQGFVDQGDVPTMLLVGGSGLGKTTAAIAMCEQLDVDWIKIPASSAGGIDTLRTRVSNFASSISFKGKRKYVILDEADGLSFVAQPALRNVIDDFADNCGFILTANYQNRIIEHIKSRCTVIEFVPGPEAGVLAQQFFDRVTQILDAEGVTNYDKKAVQSLIVKHFPDWRRILNELQSAASTGGVGPEVLLDNREISIKELVLLMKAGKFSAIRQWAADNVSSDYQAIYREFYDTAKEHFKDSYIPELVMLIAQYMWKSTTVFDQEINFVAFATEVMLTAREQWK